MASTLRPIWSHLDAPALRRQLLALTDDLLEEIFLRICCPADLIHASAACVAFRRLITDPTFLRRYRSHQPPLLFGFFDLLPSASNTFHPVEAPHPNAPAARPLANISVVNYIPPDKLAYCLCFTLDVRDGRVLIRCGDGIVPILPEFIVCDPVSGRYRMLPPIPHCDEEQGLKNVGAVFAPCAEGDDAETSFIVIGMMHYSTKFVVRVFDSGPGSWTVCASVSWDALSLSSELSRRVPLLLPPYYAYGSLYWNVNYMNRLLKLDISKAEFSIVDLPLSHDRRDVAVVEAGEGRLGMFSCTPDCKSLTYYCCNNLKNEGQRVNEWEMKNVIPLPVQDDFRFFGAQQGYIFLLGDRKVQDFVCTCYSLDIYTWKLERVIRTSHYPGYPYFGFPPSMSPRRV